MAVLSCEKVNDDFHARFSAKRRYYIYKIINRPHKVIIDAKLCWWIRERLDVDAMLEASKFLIGQHDFTSFRASSCQAKSSIRSVDYINITRTGYYIFIEICARSFLHHMVRNIVGSLVNVGSNKWKSQNIKEILGARSRIEAGVTAPAHGLYFLKVDYDD